MVGYSTERNTVPRISSMMSLNESLKYIRSGTLQKFSDSKQVFEECQLKLHHDYLTYYKLRSRGTGSLTQKRRCPSCPSRMPPSKSSRTKSISSRSAISSRPSLSRAAPRRT